MDQPNRTEMKLRPYHNPENVDESKVPDGWRFRYADEMESRPERCRIASATGRHFCIGDKATGLLTQFTYIVPITP